MRTRRLAPAAVLATALLAGCGVDTSGTGAPPQSGSAHGFPMTIDDCGHTVTRNDVPLLTAVGGLDSVVA